jgi:hypothetical protein
VNRSGQMRRPAATRSAKASSSSSRTRSWRPSRLKARTRSTSTSLVPGAEIDRRFVDTPYYVTPNDPVGQEAFGVIREAMRSKALVALGPRRSRPAVELPNRSASSSAAPFTTARPPEAGRPHNCGGLVEGG